MACNQPDADGSSAGKKQTSRNNERGRRLKQDWDWHDISAGKGYGQPRTFARRHRGALDGGSCRLWFAASLVRPVPPTSSRGCDGSNRSQAPRSRACLVRPRPSAHERPAANPTTRTANSHAARNRGEHCAKRRRLRRRPSSSLDAVSGGTPPSKPPALPERSAPPSRFGNTPGCHPVCSKNLTWGFPSQGAKNH